MGRWLLGLCAQRFPLKNDVLQARAVLRVHGHACGAHRRGQGCGHQRRRRPHCDWVGGWHCEV